MRHIRDYISVSETPESMNACDKETTVLAPRTRYNQIGSVILKSIVYYEGKQSLL